MKTAVKGILLAVGAYVVTIEEATDQWPLSPIEGEEHNE